VFSPSSGDPGDLLLAHHPEATVVVDASGSVRSCNVAAGRLLCLLGDCRGLRWSDLLPPLLAGAPPPAALGPGELERTGNSVHLVTDPPRQLQLRWVVRRAGKGDDLLVILYDGRLAAGTGTPEATDADTKLELVLAQLPVVIFTLDRDMVITSSRGTALGAQGLRQNELVGSSFAKMLGSPDHVGVVSCRRALAGERIAFDDLFVGRNLRVVVQPMRDAQGEVVGVVGIVIDVTEQVEAEQLRIRLESQLRQAQKMEAIGRLAGGVAHDFNNLLTCIMGNTAHLIENATDDEPRLLLTEALDAAQSAASLTRQLLAFSRQQVIAPRIIDLGAELTRLQPMMSRLVGQAISLDLSFPPDLWRIRADVSQLEQILVNLVVNAHDAMQGKGRILIEAANVDIDAKYGADHPNVGTGPHVRIAVTDDGEGMTEEVRAKVFEPFFTTRGKGTGLGLATVYGIIRQSEGNITVFSEPGAGSVFRCYFPRAATSDGMAQFTAITPAPSRGAETILIAEDEAELRALMRRALERQGYHVLQAGDGAEALDVAANHDGPIHLLVTDVVMPRLSGKELAVRLLERRPGIRVLFISGYSDEAIERHGVLTPDSVYLEKPVSPDALSRTVRELLDTQLAVQAT
jgi:PAS domain S-box-containing protein